jgi:Rod binding domain-containing protein
MDVTAAYSIRSNGFEQVEHFKKIDGSKPFSALLNNNSENAVKTGPNGTKIDKSDKLYEQCASLETYFLKTLISEMRKTVDKSELTDTGFAGGMYEDMLYDEYAKEFSKNAGFGFAELAYLELTGQRGKVINKPM